MSDDTIIYSTMPDYDVSVFGRPGRGYTCYLCQFGDMVDTVFIAESSTEMEGHLKAHLNVGHILPNDIFERIILDGDTIYPPRRSDK